MAGTANPATWSTRLRLAAFHLAARWSLARFERQLRRAPERNLEVLRETLTRNADSAWGRQHGFGALLAAPDLLAAWQDRIPLTTYADYEPYIERIAAGEPGVLTTDPVHMLAGSSGTTDRPKRLPRTRRAQRHHLTLVVLAEQAVVDRDVPGARRPRRGINLMSGYAPPAPGSCAVPVMAGPNAGMARLRRHIPLLWCAPEPVYTVADPVAALYLHALFALGYPAALYLQSPFAPQIVAWFGLLQTHQAELLRDLQAGTLAAGLSLTAEERAALEPYRRADPARAAAVAAALAGGLEGIVPRLWPELRYVRTVTSGSFALSLPRLRWLCGPDVVIHSGCHSSSEGVIGINLKADGSTEYVLAVGTAFFEFLPVALADADPPPTVALQALAVGTEYEIVLTSSAGLYRYRLGDVIRVTGWRQAAPTFRFLYRRGTVVNLIGEKTSEQHTAQALSRAVSAWLGHPDPVRDYTVNAVITEGVGRYTFYVELSASLPVPAGDGSDVEALLDASLGAVNPYYDTSGRRLGRLAPARLRVVRPGTFDSLLELQRQHAAPATATQVKVPRLVTRPEQIAWLESQVVEPPTRPARPSAPRSGPPRPPAPRTAARGRR